MQLIQILSTSPNRKLFRVRFRYGEMLDYAESVAWVRFNSTRAVLLDPNRKYRFWDLPIDRKKRGRGLKKVLEAMGVNV